LTLCCQSGSPVSTNEYY